MFARITGPKCGIRVATPIRFNSTSIRSTNTNQVVLGDRLNALTTLPAVLVPRREVFRQVESEAKDKGGSLKGPVIFGKKWFRFAKSILSFYKTGLKNVWNNQKLKKRLLNDNYYIDLINYTNRQSVELDKSLGLKKVKGKILSSNDLTNYLLNEIYIDKVKSKAAAPSEEQKSVRNILNILRSEYQLILRTEKDFIKLPIFGLIFVLFEELTPLVCLLVPQLIPSTCILPNVLKKQEFTKMGMLDQTVQSAHDNPSVTGAQLVNDFFIDAGKIHQCSKAEVSFLYKFFSLGETYLAGQELKKRKLVQYRNIIVLDTHLIVTQGGFSKLSALELILAANQRGLIGEDVVTDLQKLKEAESYDEGIDIAKLIKKLEQFAENVDLKA